MQIELIRIPPNGKELYSRFVSQTQVNATHMLERTNQEPGNILSQPRQEDGEVLPSRKFG